MSRDYAKQKARSTASNSINHWLWLFVGLFLGLCLSLFFIIKNKPTPLAVNSLTINQPATPSHTKTNPQKKVSHPNEKSTDAAKKQPQFDFYTLLPEAEAPLSEPKKPAAKLVTSAQTPAKMTTKPAPATSTKQALNYILQIGAFPHYADADELRAQLVLQGHEANIKTIKSHGATWNRVWMGPYSTLSAAQKSQQQLQQNHIKSIVVRIS